MEYKYFFQNNTIGLKAIDKETATELEEEEFPIGVILRDKSETVSAYLLSEIDINKYPLYNYYKECNAKKAVAYLNDKDVFPVTINGEHYYISDYSKIKLIAYPEQQQSVYPEPHNYLKDSSMYNTNSADKEAVNPIPELMDSVLTNVYSELAKMKSDYDKGELPDSCLHFEETIRQLQRLKLWN